MPGWSNADNKFGVSPFIVGAVLGDGCNYSSIQSAITDAFAAGGGSVFIRANTSPYVENLTFQPGVDLVGCSADGRVTGTDSPVSITGSHTFSGMGNVALSNIELLGDGVSSVITVSPVGVTSTLTLINCYVADAFGGIFFLPGLASTAQVKLFNCETNCLGGIFMGGPGDQYLLIEGGIYTSPSDGIQAAGGLCVITLKDCTMLGNNFGIQLATIAGATVNATGATIICLPNEAINCTGGSANVNLYHCTVESNAASTNFIDGNITFQHIDLALTGSAINNNSAITSYEDWKPYATTAASAVQPGAFRGTAAFDSAAFTVTNGWVTTIGGAPATTFPVDNGGPGAPLAGAMSFLGSTSVDFPNPSGIETHVGATTNEIYFEDRRWITAYVVDPSTTVGLQGTYSTIQAAITAAGAGPVDIFIRPGLYTENLSLTGNVNLIATSSSGTTDPTALTHVMVSGDHTISGNGGTIIDGMRFLSSATNFTVDDAGAGTAQVEFLNCTIDTTGNNFSLGGIGTGSIRCIDCTLTANARNILVPTGNIGVYELQNTTLISTGDANCYQDSAGATGRINNCTMVAGGSANFIFDTNSAGANLTVEYTRMTAPIQNMEFQAAANVTSYHNTYDPSGNFEYITGPGNYRYGDDVIIGGYASSGIDGAATQTLTGWRPWAQAGAGPVPSATTFRGTSAYDSAQFALTDGFVQLLSTAVATQYVTDAGTVTPVANSINVFGGAGVTTSGAGDTLTIHSVIWSNQGVNTTALVDNGYFATAGITLTLPAAPTIGEECRFCVATGGSLTIQADAGQTIHIGGMASSVAGTASSTSTGDVLVLTAQSATEWWATSSIGNWTLA